MLVEWVCCDCLVIGVVCIGVVVVWMLVRYVVDEGVVWGGCVCVGGSALHYVAFACVSLLSSVSHIPFVSPICTSM